MPHAARPRYEVTNADDEELYMGVTEQLAGFAIDTPSGFLTPLLAASAKSKFLDTLAVMIAGSHSPAGRIARTTALESGGIPESTIVGHADKTSMALAGFVNGVSAHALEYDDLTLVVGHASVCLVPACLAVAERLNLSGKQMVEAFAIGFEVAARVGKGLQPYILDRGWHPTGIIGAQGVAAASARMLELDAMATRMAMGIAASSAGGVRKNIGSMGKAFHIGHGVRSGIFAATMASHGFKVDPDVIERGDAGANQGYGLADAFNGPGNYRMDQMVDHLGQDLELSRNTTLVRMHPGSTPPAAAIDGIIDLALAHNISAVDVEYMQVECHPRMLAIASYPQPTDPYRAKFCLPYTFAVAFVDRKVGVAQYAEERIRDPGVLDFMRRVQVNVRGDQLRQVGHGEGNSVDWGEVQLTVRLKDGRVLTSRCRQARGWPDTPASWEDLCGKFEDCAGNIFPKSQIKESIAMIANLSDLASVRDLTKLLMVPSPS